MKSLLTIFLAVATALFASACNNGSSTESAAAPAPRASQSLPVQVLNVVPRDLSRIVEISGQVEPLRTIRLAARTDGVLTEVLVEAGDPVRDGQVLARIDVREQRAELARARANLHEKQATFERFEQLKDRAYVDAASYESARAALEVAETEIQLWQTRVDFGTVQSSIDGTVVARYIEPGEAIARHAPLFSLADLSSLVVRVGVSELDLRNLSIGDNVTVRIDAIADSNPVDGRVRRIFPAAEDSSRLIVVEVELAPTGTKVVRPGYLARVELLVDSRLDVLAVPAGSVAQSDGAYYVMVVDSDDRLARRIVEPGIIRGNWREITTGLEPGDRVVSANPQEMSEGEKVRIVDWTT